jgi:hypothetical protein
MHVSVLVEAIISKDVYRVFQENLSHFACSYLVCLQSSKRPGCIYEVCFNSLSLVEWNIEIMEFQHHFMFKCKLFPEIHSNSMRMLSSSSLKPRGEI